MPYTHATLASGRDTSLGRPALTRYLADDSGNLADSEGAVVDLLAGATGTGFDSGTVSRSYASGTETRLYNSGTP